MPDGNAPFSGGSGPTWNDAMFAGEILRRRQGLLPENRPPDKWWLRKQLIRAVIWAVIIGIIAIAFLASAFSYFIIGQEATTVNPLFSVVLGAIFGVLALHQARRALLFRRCLRDG